MTSTFFKAIIRNLCREKKYAVINIAGLSLAIASYLILGLYLRSEFTYDRHHTKHKQIFRVVNEFGKIRKIRTAFTSRSLGPMLVEDYPEIKDFVRFNKGGTGAHLFHREDDAFFWNIYFTDDNVFEVFTHDIIYGDPKTALVDPTSVAVSESFARKYFNDANPIGETINDDTAIYKITLVFADLPENSHLKYDVLASYKAKELIDPDKLTPPSQRLYQFSDYTYLLMPENYDVRDFKDISDSFYARYMAETGNGTWRCWLQPLADIHLKSDVMDDLPTANQLYLYGFTAVALFILIVACINYMNLTIAMSAKRIKEICMRKILGAGRTRLMFRFFSESIFFTLISFIFAIVLVQVALQLTPINDILNKPLELNIIYEPITLVWLFIFGLVVGLMSGIYPAIYLSSILPLSALVKNNQTGKGSFRLRQLLVLIQFTISLFVITCTLLMVFQMQYVSNKSLGFDKENRIIVTLRDIDLIDKIPIIRKELMQNSSILGVSASATMLGQRTSMYLSMVDNNDGILEEISLKNIQVDDHFIEVMRMQIIAGRDFSKKSHTDVEESFIVNETMVKKMGWDQPLGKRIQMGISNGRVIGVVKDFHYASLHSQVEPIALHRFVNIRNMPPLMRQYRRCFLVLNISGEKISQTIDFLKDKFAEFNPKYPFEFEFLDDSLERLYLSERHIMKLVGIFATLCIFISCLGLFGLTTFTTERRSKEIGIRKVLGASTWQIITMLAENILLLVLGGAVIASLTAYYVMHEWLTDFAYRINLNKGLWVFLVSAVVVAIMAFITVAFQSFKTAQTNPVDALRHE